MSAEENTEAETITLAAAAVARDTIGSTECLQLLHRCIYYGWLKPMSALARTASSMNNTKQQLELLEASFMESDVYDESTTVQMWHILSSAWPEAVSSRLDYLARQAFEFAPLPVWEELLYQAKAIKTPGELQSLCILLKNKGRSDEHEQLLAKAVEPQTEGNSKDQ